MSGFQNETQSLNEYTQIGSQQGQLLVDGTTRC